MAKEEELREYLRWVTNDLHRARQRLLEMENREREPIAIVGMSCRYPGGVDSPEALWRLVDGGADAVGDFPADRGWDLDALYDPDPERSGTCYTRQGGFLYDAADFDPGFFGISPREAQVMDPQQRLLLETSWEVVERAGLDPRALRGSATGVFVGVSGRDYGDGLDAVPAGAEGFLLTGTATSVASGRIAYTLGLEGPAVTIDTACSSSLVAMHLACQALRLGECSMAMAGGVAVMSTPAVLVEFSRQRGLSPDGRCKAYADAADGTGWGEGAGMVLLERLSDARRRNHRVLGVIRGSAVNQDGASNGLTAPNGLAQQAVIRQALVHAGVTADQVDVVEGHGTGTTLGDPIEAQALLDAYGPGRPADRPLWLGSVKSNLGHTQAAAGVAGVIKMVMAMRHGVLPKTLHVDRPSRHVDWSAGAVSLLTESRPWPAGEDPRRAAVSAFGVSGTNAHLILEQDTGPSPEAGAPAAEPFGGSPTVPWPLSGRTPEALAGQAARLLAPAAPDGTDPRRVAAALATTRSGFEHRAVVLAADAGARTAALEALAAGREAPQVVLGSVVPGSGPVFVFPGQGSQWAGMARRLAERVPAFRASIERCAAALDPHTGWSLTAVLGQETSAPPLDRVDVVQPALFAVMVSLAELWESLGVRPAAVIGHSQGEIAAAYVCGALSLDDAAKVVALRSRALRGIAGRGGMVSVALPAGTLREWIDRDRLELHLAAVNGPGAVVVAGEPGALDALIARCAEQGIRARRVPVDYASHSPHVDELTGEIRGLLAGVEPGAARVPFLSSVTGEPFDTTGLTPEYWCRNLRETVEFERAVRAALDQRYGVFVEVSPHPVLLPAIQETIEAAGRPGATVGTLRRDEDDVERMIRSAAEAGTRGLPVDWTAVLGGTFAPVELPTYAFQRTRHWLDEQRPAAPASGTPDESEPAFWDAVERGDLAELGRVLRVDAGLDAWRLVLPELSEWRRDRRQESAVRSWRYHVRWKPMPPTAAPPATGSWAALVPATAADRLEPLVALLGACPVVVPETGDQDVLAGLLGDLDVDGVLSLLALGDPGRALTGTLALIRALAGLGRRTPLWVLTEGAVSVGRSDPPPVPDQAAVAGLARVAALEHPEIWGGLADLPAGLGDGVERLAALLTGDEDQVAVRSSGAYARRMVRTRTGPDAGTPWQPRGTVLVTGGTGAIGGEVATWLARSGVRHVVLTSRRGPDAPGASELRDRLRALGAEVTVAACDVADRAALAALLDEVGPVSAVVHAAGVGQFTMLADTDAGEMASVVSGKVEGARNLDALLDGEQLDAFVLFSSGAAVWGSAGQGAYAAGNAYLDALAEARRARGAVATSVAWGSWAGGGMVDDEADALLRRRGVRPMAPERAVRALADAVGRDDATAVVADVDWARFVPTFTLARRRPLIEDIPEVAEALRAPAAAAEDGASALRERLRELTDGERRGELLSLVRTQAALVLGHSSADAVTASRAFRDLGFDSLTAVELRNRLTTATGLRLPTTIVFDQPSAEVLARHLLAELLPDASSAAAVPTAAAPADEPVAIVGMACRFPGGADSPEALWRLVQDETDAVTDFPADRGWDVDRLFHPDPDHPGTSYVRHGAFLDGAADFDADFFGISPREALAMDPQQRLLLETTWEALERAGVDPRRLRGSRTGVFAGVAGGDYADRAATAPPGAEGYLGTGNAASVASGRVAYLFGLEGPALTVDTACSSSLVALHLAAQALRRDECSLALAGGVAVLSSPKAFVEFSRQRGLAPDGRCKPFAAAADGTAWGEGVGVLVLERLSDARRNGHRVLALVRGSAVNSDGASNGLTAPNGPSQQRVIQQALASAGLAPREVDAVEAHGTGTTLGDPIEAQALLATYGQDRDGAPLWLGSVKSNIGHTAASAGMAGIVKMVMAMRHGELPRTLHVDEPTPHVDWSSGGVRLLTDPVAWPETGRPRRAGVSAFGISGTNAHVILEQGPGGAPAEPPAGTPAGPVAWLLSAAGPEALRDQARRLRESLTGRPLPPARDVAVALATTRAALEHRAVLVGAETGELLERLTAIEDGRPRAGVWPGTARSGKLAVLFSGQGAQRAGMGRELYVSHPVFAEALDEVCSHLDPHLDRPLRDALFDAETPDADHPMHRTEYTQAALFAVEVALFRLLSAWGVTPEAVGGHSIGEITAAHVAGILSLADACRLVAARGRLMQALPPGGAMMAVEADEATVRQLLAGREHEAAVAAVNAPRSVVVSGVEAAVRAVADAVAEGGGRVKRLRVSHAFHSPLMAPMLAEFGRVAEDLTYEPARIPVLSALTGALATGDDLRTAEYWTRHVREAVRFADGIAALRRFGADTFLEVGPDSVLTAPAQDCLAASDGEVTCVAVQRGGRPEAESLMAAVAALVARGTEPDWAAVLGAAPAAPVDLPTYPFQRRRYWLASVPGDDPTSLGLSDPGHPLLGAGLDLPGTGEHAFSARVSARTHPWLLDHAVAGSVVVPGTAFVEMVLAAGTRVGAAHVEELTLTAPLVLAEGAEVVLRVVVGEPDGDERRTVAVHARRHGAEEAWAQHASGVLTPQPAYPGDVPLWPPDAEPLPLGDHYAAMAGTGFRYGPAFQGLVAARRIGGDIGAEARLPETLDPDRYGIHPALFDAALHGIGLGAFLPAGGRPRLPFSWRGVTLYRPGARSLRVQIRAAGNGAVAVVAADEHGAPVFTIEELTLRELPEDALSDTGEQVLLRAAWETVDTAGLPAGGARWDAFGDPELVRRLAGAPDAEVLAHAGLAERDAAGAPVPDAVFWAVPGTGEGVPEPDAVAEVTEEARRTLRDWLAGERSGVPLIVVTSGAVREVPAPGGAAVWGMVRSAQQEHPGRFVLLDIDDDPDSVWSLPDAVAAALHGEQTQLALRGGEVSAPRWVPAAEPSPGDPGLAEPGWGDGTVLVTGATGWLGGLVARHLATAHGVRRLLLVGRRGRSAEGMPELIDDLTAAGAEVDVAAADVADRDELAAVLAAVPAERPLTAVVHAAGIVADAVVSSLSAERLRAVLRPKVDGAINLHELTREHELAAFVLFSSIAGTFGGAGQGAYAAANAFLDALSTHRRAAGLAAGSLAWGPWDAEAGMTAELGAAHRDRMRRAGLLPLSARQGLTLFDRALRLDAGTVVVARAEKKAAGPADAGATVRPAGRPAVGPDRPDFRTLPPAERVVRLTEVVREAAAAVLGHGSTASIRADRAFKDVGFDSLTAVELRNQLTAATGVRLPATLIFDYPAPATLAEHLSAQIGGADSGAAAAPDVDALERWLLTGAGDADDRKAVAGRLRALLGRWEAAAATAPERAEADIAGTTADELLSIIDQEFGDLPR
ncbi:type I polyketide synthase [Actinoplanes sp. NPDC048796]|uniref:type I polyketide synthase n=1 Tax=Actinoplanes sp. NPDC048796 TaxID=3155640 RepID=UPI00340453E5